MEIYSWKSKTWGFGVDITVDNNGTEEAESSCNTWYWFGTQMLFLASKHSHKEHMNKTEPTMFM